MGKKITINNDPVTIKIVISKAHYLIFIVDHLRLQFSLLGVSKCCKTRSLEFDILHNLAFLR